jgi:hypothetical protein
MLSMSKAENDVLCEKVREYGENVCLDPAYIKGRRCSLQLHLFFLHQTHHSIKTDINWSSTKKATSHTLLTRLNKLHTPPNNMFFFGSSRIGKSASEAVQTPRASTSSERNTPTPARQQARKQGKKLSVTEDYWTNPALWPVGAPPKRS